MADVKVIVNCSTREVSEKALTKTEQTQRLKDEATFRAEMEKADAERLAKTREIKAALGLSDEQFEALREVIR